MADDEIDLRAEFLAAQDRAQAPRLVDAEGPSVHWDASLPLEYEARYRTASVLGTTRLTVNVPIPDPDARFQIDVTVRKIPAPS